jgi:NitT/TauT family transport system ATP-binding protein
VVVLSSQPGTVKAIVPIELPRPRDAVTIRGDARFGAYVVRIWELLR